MEEQAPYGKKEGADNPINTINPINAIIEAQSENEENILEKLKKENIEIQKELKEREILLAKRQELKAREILGGKGFALPQTPQETPEQKASRERIKAIGKSTGASWAEKM